MDVIKAIQHYVDKMINDVPGMKVLLLDMETVSLEENCIVLCKVFWRTSQDTHSVTGHDTICIADKGMLPNWSHRQSQPG